MYNLLFFPLIETMTPTRFCEKILRTISERGSSWREDDNVDFDDGNDE